MATGTDINERTIDSLADKRVRLTNARMGRKHLIVPTDWTALRVGIRMCFEGVDGSVSGNPNFRFGFCSEPNNISPSPSCLNAVYYRTRDSSWLNVTSTDTLRRGVDIVGAADNFSKTVAGVESQAGNQFPSWWSPLNDSPSGGSYDLWSSCLFLELTKLSFGAGNIGTSFNIRTSFPDGNATNSMKHELESDLVAGMSASTMASIAAVMPNSSRNSVNANLTFTEADGILNSVFVSWDLPTYRVEVSGIKVSIVS